MPRPPLEVADLIRVAGEKFVQRSRKWFRGQHLKVLNAIERCRTAALGATWTNAPAAGIAPFLTTPAEIGTAPSARPPPVTAGSQRALKNFCLRPTCT